MSMAPLPDSSNLAVPMGSENQAVSFCWSTAGWGGGLGESKAHQSVTAAWLGARSFPRGAPWGKRVSGLGFVSFLK